jgi:tellurite resistance protein
MNSTPIAPSTPDVHHETSLAHFPVALFSTVMGIAGLALAWQKAAHVLGWSGLVGQGLAALAGLVFLVVAGFYGTKLLRHWAAARAEAAHPVKMNLAMFALSMEH